MDKGPIKSVIISGNLRNNKIVYKLCPVTEFSCGVWNIAIKGLSYNCKIDNYKEVCKISCNLVKGQKFNKYFEVQTYQQPFGSFILEEGQYTINFGEK